jgi:hypothetical protein
MVDALGALDWQYKAEGNANIVFTYSGNDVAYVSSSFAMIAELTR